MRAILKLEFRVDVEIEDDIEVSQAIDYFLGTFEYDISSLCDEVTVLNTELVTSSYLASKGELCTK